MEVVHKDIAKEIVGLPVQLAINRLRDHNIVYQIKEIYPVNKFLEDKNLAWQDNDGSYMRVIKVEWINNNSVHLTVAHEKIDK